MGIASDIAEKALRQVTGNGVCSDISSDLALQLVNDAFEECLPWFDEKDVFKTEVTIKIAHESNGEIAGRQSYIDFSASGINLEVKTVRYVYEIRLNREYTGDLVRDLLLLPASPLETQSIMEIAQWQMTWPMVKEVLGRNMRFNHIKSENKLYIDDAQGGAVTFVYVPLISSVEQVTYRRALTWISEMSKALIKEAIGRVRGKFRGGALRFETDADTLLSEAMESQRELREQLPRLQFVMGIR